MNAFFSRLSLIALYGVTLTPLLYIDAFFFPAISTKFFWFSLCIIVLSIAILAHYATTQNILRISLTLPDIFLCSIVGILALSTAMSDHPLLSFWSDFERLDGFVLWILLCIYYIGVACFTLYTKSSYIAAFVASGLVVALFAIKQFADANLIEFRVDALMGNPLFLGQFALVMIGVALYGMVTRKNAAARYFYGATALLLGFVVLLSGSRGMTLALIFSALFGALLFSTMRRRYVEQLWSNRLVRIGLLISILLLPLLFYLSPVSERIDLSNFTEIETNNRYFIWEAALDMIAERPMLGWGLNQFQFHFYSHFEPRYFDPTLIQFPERWFDKAHNAYLGLGIAGGIGIPLLLLLTFGLLSVQLYRARTPQSFILLIALSALAVSMFFSFVTIVPLIVSVFLLAACRPYSPPMFQYQFTNRPIIVAGSVIGVFAVLLFAWITLERVNDSLSLRNALDTNKDSFARGVALHAIQPELTFSSDALHVHETSLIALAEGITATSTPEQKDTARSILATTTLSPFFDVHPKLFYNTAVAYARLGSLDIAQQIANDHLMADTNWLPFTTFTGALFLSGTPTPEAITFLEQQYERAPYHPITKSQYLALRIKNGDITNIQAQLAHHFSSPYVYDRDILLALIAVEENDYVKKILRAQQERAAWTMFDRAVFLLAHTADTRAAVLRSWRDTIRDPEYRVLKALIENDDISNAEIRARIRFW